MKIIENVCYKNTNSDENMLDIYLPDTDAFPVFVYFHGGGLETGSKSENKFYKALVKKGVAVVTANYRLYPNAKFPDFIEDAAATVAWAYKNMSNYGKISSFFVGGSSAGGYISQMLCFDKKYLSHYGIDSDSVDGYIHDSAQPTTHFNILRERGIDTRRVIIDEAAPLYHITKDRNYAPMKIIVSDNDMQNRLEQTMLLISTLKTFGCNENNVDFNLMKDSEHCSYVDAQNEDGKWLFADMIYEFICKTIKNLRF